MQCDCCGRKKKMFESFAVVKTNNDNLNFCVDCNNLAYKVRDAANELNEVEFDNLIKEWEKKEKKPSENYLNWKKTFIATLQQKMKVIDEVDEEKHG